MVHIMLLKTYLYQTFYHPFRSLMPIALVHSFLHLFALNLQVMACAEIVYRLLSRRTLNGCDI
jgi:hypothetical protein